MKINEIPADTEVTITEELIRVFRMNECDPTCHCCGIEIVAGMVFKLAYIKTIGGWLLGGTKEENLRAQEPEDEMLCQNCTADDLISYKEKLWQEDHDAYYKRRHQGYTRAHIF